VKRVGFKTGFSANFADLYRKKNTQNWCVKNKVHYMKTEKINDYAKNGAYNFQLPSARSHANVLYFIDLSVQQLLLLNCYCTLDF
jgi:hypothetical protein